MKVVVTGVRGFIGQHVARLFAHNGCDVMGWARRSDILGRRDKNIAGVTYASGNLGDWRYIRSVLGDFRPDAIIHLAANPIVKYDETADPAEIINDNILSTQSLLASAPEGCVFVNASSATVYGEVVSEEGGAYEDYDLTVPNTVYGATKLASESLVCAYSLLGRIRGVNLRLVANVGAGATHGVVKDLTAKLYSDNPNLELLGAFPGSTKPFIHVEDTAKAFWMAAADPLNWGVKSFRAAINLSSTTTLSVDRLADVIMDELNIVKPKVWLGEKANWRGDHRIVNVDNHVAMNSLRWNPRFPNSEDAVRQAVRDIIEESK